MHFIAPTLRWLKNNERVNRTFGVAVIDIDGVMEDNRHRLHHICEVRDGVSVRCKNADWDAYTSLAHLDTPGAGVDIARALRRSHTILYLTARVGDDETAVNALAARMEGYTGFYAPVLMRPPLELTGKSQHVSAHVFKAEVLDLLAFEGLRVTLGVDDSLKNCEVFKERGIAALRMHNHIDHTMLRY